MEDLFRFTLRRPPSRVDDNRVIDLVENTQFQRTLASSQSPAEMRELAGTKFLGGEFKDTKYVDGIQKLTYGPKLLDFERTLRSAGTPERLQRNEVAPLVERTIGAPAVDVVDNPQFKADRKNAADSIIAITLLTSEQLKPGAW